MGELLSPDFPQDQSSPDKYPKDVPADNVLHLEFGLQIPNDFREAATILADIREARQSLLEAGMPDPETVFGREVREMDEMIKEYMSSLTPEEREFVTRLAEHIQTPPLEDETGTLDA